AITGISYTDTANDDTFNAVSGTLSASDRDIGDSKAFSITGGAADATLAGLDVSKTGTYGKLYLNSSNGDYRYVPNDTAIEGLKANASESFTLVVTDGSGATASQSLAINITGVNDTPVITAGNTLGYT